MSRVYVGIPARLGATRLPGKPLRHLLDRTLIEHVYHRCCLAKEVDEVFVAACDNQVQEVIEAIGGKVVMTDPNIMRPALRVAAASKILDLKPDDLIVTVQGDEPLIRPEMIDAAIQAYRQDPSALCVCLMATANKDEWGDTNEIKVVVDQKSYAMYFSRSPIPSSVHQEAIKAPVYKQVCVFPFTVAKMYHFLDLPETPFEKGESIELLRALEHGEKVKMVLSHCKTKSVDTQEDLDLVTAMMAKDDIYQLYADRKKVLGGPTK